jgi:hypothetical protein
VPVGVPSLAGGYFDPGVVRAGGCACGGAAQIAGYPPSPAIGFNPQVAGQLDHLAVQLGQVAAQLGQLDARIRSLEKTAPASGPPCPQGH